MSFPKSDRHETVIYLVLWGILFIEPVMNFYFRMAGQPEATFDWNGIFRVWREYGVFFGLFLVHNYLLAPLLVRGHRRVTYFSIVAVVLVAFTIYQCQSRPKERRHHKPRFEQFENHRPPEFSRERGPMEPRMEPKIEPMGPNHHDIVTFIILVLMLGMNLGVKLYFKQRSDQKHLAQLERQNLEQQLEYLKYQINPHFFMNTLNNIHALVDIDPEKAKSTILELSKMMRFMLYEGNKSVVPLEREISFLQNYITLMKLRYTDKVRISVDIPASLPNKEVPPLMFITFVENAFKHGVSYRQESFIDIAMGIDSDRLTFTCVNSRIPKEEDKHGGVGLANVRQRLDLIYGQNYQLDIRDEQASYTVKLTLPL